MNLGKKVIVLFVGLTCFCFNLFPASIAIVANSNAKTVSDAASGFKFRAQTYSNDVSFTIIDPSAAAGTNFNVYDLVFILAADQIKPVMVKTDKPVVFGMVYDPVERGIVTSLGPSGKNITGVSLNIPVQKQITAIKDVLPGVKNIGLFYSSKMSGFARAAREACASANLTLVAVPVDSTAQMLSAWDNNKSSINVLWIIPDPAIYNAESLSYILKKCAESRIPAIGFNESTVKAGALCGYSCDFEDIGAQAGEIAARILGGENPGTIPIAAPRKIKYFFNKKICEFLGITIPAQTLRLGYDVN